TTLSNPNAMLAMTRGIVRRLRERDFLSAPPARVATIAIVSADGSLAHLEVAEHLTTALRSIGPTQALTSSIVNRELTDDDRQAASRWFDDRARDHAYTLYIGDASTTAWTGSCIRQADKVLLVVGSHATPDYDGADVVGASSARCEQELSPDLI